MINQLRFCLLGSWLWVAVTAHAQFTFGTTGLLHMPTAEMQKDKTLMAGWGWLDEHATPNRVGIGWADEPTMNYYFNITIFPWLEVGYDCTLMRGKYLAAIHEVNPNFFKKWANQDRNFSVRLCAWEEGKWKWWMPQIVVGVNDVLHTFAKNGSGIVGVTKQGNGFWGRMYLVATKHFELNQIGTVGAHVAYLHNNRSIFLYEGIGVGANLQLDKIQTGAEWADQLTHGINVMAEYDTRTFNVGLGYSIWDDHINLIAEMNELKYFSGGVVLKIHLK